MRYLIYPRTMNGRISPELQIDCDEIEMWGSSLVFGKAGREDLTLADDPDLARPRTIAVMAAGTWGVVTTADGLVAYKADEKVPASMYPDPSLETP